MQIIAMMYRIDMNNKGGTLYLGFDVVTRITLVINKILGMERIIDERIMW
jgi:hypothetical protein